MISPTLNVLLYSALPQNLLGGIAAWTSTYLMECENHGLHCILVNCAAEGARAENPEARITMRDEIVRTFRIFKELWKALKTKPNIAHVNTSCGPYGIIRDSISVWMMKHWGVKVVLHFHCDIPYWVNSRISKLCLKGMCKNADQLFVLCHSSAEYLRDSLGEDSVTIPNFVSDDNIAACHEIRGTIRNIFYVGGVQPEKGCYELFDAAKSYPDKHFRLVGQQSEDVKKKKLPDNVELLGSMPHEKVLELMDQADLFLFPSYSEGFSLALAEAMSRGLPVITTDVGANFDMIEDRGGVIVPVGDVQSIVNAIRQLEKKQIRADMSRWNIQKAREYYTSDKVLEQMKGYYLRTLSWEQYG